MFDWLVNNIWILPLVIYFSLLLRYLLFTYLFYWLMWVKFPHSTFLVQRKISDLVPFKGQIKTELMRTLSSLFIIGLYETFIFVLYLKGYTQLNTNIKSTSLLMEIFYFIAIFIFHDAFFYFTHRLLHTNWLFKKVHYQHHQSRATNPCTSYSFHWVEALIQSIYTLPIIFLLPMHIGTFIIALALTQLIVTSGHCGYDLLPKGIWHSKYFGWLTTSTHHNHHHLYVENNYALLSKFWDKVFNTLNPETEKSYNNRL